MADSKSKRKEESKPRQVGPKHSVNLPTLRRLPMPHEQLIPRHTLDRPAGNTGPALDIGSADNVGPTSELGPTLNTSVALREVGPVENTGPVPATRPEREFSLLNSLPDVEGYMFWFHQVTDYLDRQLTPFEQSIYKHLYRLSWGFEKATCTIGFPKLAERTNMSETAARQAAKGLVRKGLVKKRGMVFGKGVEQGVEWEVLPPPALTKHKEEKNRRVMRNAGPAVNAGPTGKQGPVPSTPIKETTQKEIPQTQAGVSGSRFSLEHCRRYAEHLHKTGQGIVNPGGFATKIHRSGEADELIEAFVHPAAQKPQTCPLCERSNGFIYVDEADRDKGVRACRHGLTEA